MEDPRRGEKAGPCLNLILKCLCLGGHEEPGIFTNLSQIRVTKTVLDDTVDETQGNGMVLHLAVVEIVKPEGGTLLDDNRIIVSIKRLCRLKGDLVFNTLS